MPRSKPLRICDKCSFNTNEITELIEHMKLKHLLDDLYPCDLCNFYTESLWDYQGHIEQHIKKQVTSSHSSQSNSTDDEMIQNDNDEDSINIQNDNNNQREKNINLSSNSTSSPSSINTDDNNNINGDDDQSQYKVISIFDFYLSFSVFFFIPFYCLFIFKFTVIF
jgi:hypothetical protein